MLERACLYTGLIGFTLFVLATGTATTCPGPGRC